MSLRRIVAVVEALALVAALAFVLLLFANEPDGGGGAQSPGATVYASSCARCHGASGQGGIGPRLAGRVEDRFPDAADAERLVANGRRGMPAFSGRLTDEEIRAVVEYTRTGLTDDGEG